MSFTEMTREEIIGRMQDPELLRRRSTNIIDATKGMTDDQREAILQLFFMLAETQTALTAIINHLGIQ